MSAEPTFAEIVRLALESRLSDVHVALPGRVEKYDPTTLTAEVLPMVRRAIEDTTGTVQHEELPPIPNVRVLFPQSSAFSASWPLAPGDFVLLVFCSAAIGNWRESGDVSDPGDLRRHDLSHAVALPGFAPEGSVIPTSPTAAVVEVNAPATHLAIGAGVAAEFVVLADKLETAINNHTHSGVTVGAGTTGIVAPPLLASAFAASKLKSE